MRHSVLPLVALIGASLLPACASLARNDAPGTPEAAVADLLQTDRDFARRSEGTDLVTGLSSMFDERIYLNARGAMHHGRAPAITALRDTPDALTSRATWTPVRGGISADGLHGFTFGYMTMTRADGTTQPGKYLAYWIRGDEGWRVVAYRRALRPAGDVSLAPLPPSLPDHLVSPTSDSAVIRAHAASVADAERAFSAEAQVIGLGPAFEKFGRADAVNMGGPQSAEFVRGNVAIGQSVGAGATADDLVIWGPEHVFVASSGDLGVTIGTIEIGRKSAGDGAPRQRVPFFTIWRRDGPGAPWRYIAE